MTALWCGVGEAIIHFADRHAARSTPTSTSKSGSSTGARRALDDLSLVGSMLSETAIKIAITHRGLPRAAEALPPLVRVAGHRGLADLRGDGLHDGHTASWSGHAPTCRASTARRCRPASRPATSRPRSATARWRSCVFWHTRKYWLRALAVVVTRCRTDHRGPGAHVPGHAPPDRRGGRHDHRRDVGGSRRHHCAPRRGTPSRRGERDAIAILSMHEPAAAGVPAARQPVGRARRRCVS